MDQLSVKLNASNIGGDIGGVLVNHLCYSNDICLISLSSAGLQQLLNICDTYAKEYKLLYNFNCIMVVNFIPYFSTQMFSIYQTCFYIEPFQHPYC